MGEIGTQYSGVSIITEGEPFMAYYGLEVGGDLFVVKMN